MLTSAKILLKRLKSRSRLKQSLAARTVNPAGGRQPRMSLSSAGDLLISDQIKVVRGGAADPEALVLPAGLLAEALPQSGGIQRMTKAAVAGLVSRKKKMSRAANLTGLRLGVVGVGLRLGLGRLSSVQASLKAASVKRMTASGNVAGAGVGVGKGLSGIGAGLAASLGIRSHADGSLFCSLVPACVFVCLLML